MNRQIHFVAAAVALAAMSGGAQAQANYYEGKTIRLVVGLAAGGGFDTYARTIGRHLGKHIPGNPTVVVDNMTGAGGIVMMNHLYKAAKPDGLTLGHFNGAAVLGQILGQKGIEFDARKYEFLGAAVKDDVVCGLTKASGITSIDAWRAAKAPVKLGGVAPGQTPDNSARIMNAALGLPVQVVSGYKGTSQIRLAAESGELAGGCWSWESMRATWKKGLEAGEVIPVVQVVAKPLADIPNVPLAINLARTEDAKKLILVGVQNSSAFARPFALPPGTPKDRVEILHKAFHATLKDPAFLAEAQKANLSIDPITGDEMKRLVEEVFTLDAAVLAKLKEALFPQ
ncbi:MAG: Bug family tripartite tricarboxylate transporter substrate binding protein [Burkholderiales bacterium]